MMKAMQCAIKCSFCTGILLSVAGDVVIFGSKPSDGFQIQSDLKSALSAYRQYFAGYMSDFEHSLRYIDEYNCVDDLIKEVHDEFRVVIQSLIPQAWNRNIDVIEKFTQLHISSRLTFAISTGFLTRLNSLEVHDAESTCYSSLEQVLLHMHRDWSEAASNNKIITKITEYLMNHAIDSNLSRILVPGAGLGRLAVELATAGFRCTQQRYSVVHP